MRWTLWLAVLIGIGIGWSARLLMAPADDDRGVSAGSTVRSPTSPSPVETGRALRGSALLRALRREEARLVQTYGTPPTPPTTLPEIYRDEEAIEQRIRSAIRSHPEVEISDIDCIHWPCVITVRHPRSLSASDVADTLDAQTGLALRRLGGGESLDRSGARWWSLAVMPDAPLTPDEERYLYLRGARQQDGIGTSD